MQVRTKYVAPATVRTSVTVATDDDAALVAALESQLNLGDERFPDAKTIAVTLLWDRAQGVFVVCQPRESTEKPQAAAVEEAKSLLPQTPPQ